MTPGARDVAQIRLDNALLLFDEFVHATVKHPDAATLRGLERRFAERLVHPARRLVAQHLELPREALADLPRAALDLAPVAGLDLQPHGEAAHPGAATPEEPPHNVPQDDDERFIVGLVLTYYRRHPQRARTRLLDLLGEVLSAAAPTPPAPPAPGKTPARAGDDGTDLWMRTQTGVAPLKRKR